MRSEKKIFADLAQLCAEPGFVHVIAYFCWRDNMFKFSDELEVEHVLSQLSPESLCRTEISTLIGLMLKHEIDFSLPQPKKMQLMIGKAEALLHEMHQRIAYGPLAELDLKEATTGKFNPFASASALREPIFYGADSAYTSQYIDLAEQKYSKDDFWLREKKGHSAKDIRDVIACIIEIRAEKTIAVHDLLTIETLNEWTPLPAFIFGLNEVSDRIQKDIGIVQNVLNSFSIINQRQNEQFLSISDFNIANAYPLIRLENEEYLLLQQYNLVEAYYETPFFWFVDDESYTPMAMENRGTFTEDFSANRLKLVFGENNVHSNVEIINKGNKVAGEIDVLVVFGDRAIILQAKSKKLSIAARKGNDSVLKEDFKKAIQKAYDQGLSCAKLLEDSTCKLHDTDSNELDIAKKFKHVYIFCVVSDHYPALSFQSRQFLVHEETDTILPPFVMDVFLLDVMTEMLHSPLQFLSYTNRRVLYSDKLFSTHELTILSYHLKNNLWLDDEYTQVFLSEDISADLDLAMMVRREGVPGKSTPDGILTRYKDTAVGNLIEQIESLEDPGSIDLGFMLLLLSEDSTTSISKGIEKLIKLTRRDGKLHDLTLALDAGDTGLTIHCTRSPMAEAEASLGLHCTKRKYTQQATNWFGVCLDPDTKQLRFGMAFYGEWKKSAQLDELVKDLPTVSGKLKKNTRGKGFGNVVESTKKKNKNRS